MTLPIDWYVSLIITSLSSIWADVLPIVLILKGSHNVTCGSPAIISMSYISLATLRTSLKPSLNNRDIRSGEVFINDSKVGDLGSVNKQMYFYPYEIDSIKDDNVMRIKIIDETGSEYEENVRFFVETETLE